LPLATYIQFMHLHAYVPPAALTRRATARAAAERFIGEHAIASYLVEDGTLKKTLLRIDFGEAW
jgi:hypothetical protein